MTRYEAGTCNTICDITGFNVKLNETVTMWNGRRVIPEAASPRHPQDFPPTIIPTVVYKEARAEQYYSTEAITAFTII